MHLNLELDSTATVTGTPTLLCIHLLYPLNVDVNVIIQNPLYHWDVTT